MPTVSPTGACRRLKELGKWNARVKRKRFERRLDIQIVKEVADGAGRSSA